MNRRWLLPWLVLTGASGCTAPAGAPELAERRTAVHSAAARVDAIIEGRVRDGFSGSALLATEDQVLLHRGYGTVAGELVRANDRFWIASITKQFTAAAILKLRERGRLDLDDRLSRFFSDAPADKREITIRQLLTHMSGFPQEYASDGIEVRSVALNRIFGQPLASPPGANFGYSNDNYQIAAAIVEILSGLQFEAFVTEELLGPAGLRETGFWGTPGAETVTQIPSPIPAELLRRHWGQIGSGGMFSTVHDLFRWFRAVRRGDVLGDKGVRDLFAVHVQQGSVGIGFNWFTTADRGAQNLWTRGNESFGANGIVDTYPKDDIVLVLLSHAGDNSAGAPWTRALKNELGSPLPFRPGGTDAGSGAGEHGRRPAPNNGR